MWKSEICPAIILKIACKMHDKQFHTFNFIYYEPDTEPLTAPDAVLCVCVCVHLTLVLQYIIVSFRGLLTIFKCAFWPTTYAIILLKYKQ